MSNLGLCCQLEEREWLQLDKILCPHVFGVEELEYAEEISERDVEGDLSSSVIKRRWAFLIHMFSFYCYLVAAYFKDPNIF